ncbi:flagellar FlbD family protein [Kurthia massiliensis]|uniref:flagellar FlbD family protein n=1 Tax=Kurthia massiliensis TaxID=1033739 RepID=UPI0002E5D68A|nr:flagellar FlbD family protein [Kurthia massiliensis]
MIALTKLNGKTFSLNALYIESVEEFPDTTITLTTGRKYVVLEPESEVVSRMQAFYRDVQLLSNPHLRGEKDNEE